MLYRKIERPLLQEIYEDDLEDVGMLYTTKPNTTKRLMVLDTNCLVSTQQSMRW